MLIEGVAEDGTIEAIRIADAPGFALGVQWHAEYDAQRNPINRKTVPGVPGECGAWRVIRKDGQASCGKRAAFARRYAQKHNGRRDKNWEEADAGPSVVATRRCSGVGGFRRRRAVRRAA